MHEPVSEPPTVAPDAAPQTTRRDVLRIAAGAGGAVGVIGAVGAALVMVPHLDRSGPDAAGTVEPDAIDVDLTPLLPGQQILVFWRTWPVFVVRRTAEALTTLESEALAEQLLDPESKQLQQPPYAANPRRSVKPEFAVLVGVCTHMGCMPQFHPLPNAKEPEPDWIGGYFCPCHGSKYDLAGRVFKGVPAPYNLPVPPHRFVGDRTLRVGENPPNEKFDFSSILQI